MSSMPPYPDKLEIKPLSRPPHADEYSSADRESAAIAAAGGKGSGIGV